MLMSENHAEARTLKCMKLLLMHHAQINIINDMYAIVVRLSRCVYYDIST